MCPKTHLFTDLCLLLWWDVASQCNCLKGTNNMTRVTNSGTLSRKNFTAKNKRILSTVFSTVLFLGCAIFVASRGYICFEKFLGKPEKVDISFKFTGTQKFPSISICTKQFFNEDVFDECQLSVANYTSRENPVWVSLIFPYMVVSLNPATCYQQKIMSVRWISSPL